MSALILLINDLYEYVEEIKKLNNVEKKSNNWDVLRPWDTWLREVHS